MNLTGQEDVLLTLSLLAATLVHGLTPGRRQSKMLLANGESESKIARNSVFDCHLSPVGRQMAIKNSVSNYFYLHSLIVLRFVNAAYPVWVYCNLCNQFEPRSGQTTCDIL